MSQIWKKPSHLSLFVKISEEVRLSREEQCRRSFGKTIFCLQQFKKKLNFQSTWRQNKKIKKYYIKFEVKKVFCSLLKFFFLKTCPQCILRNIAINIHSLTWKVRIHCIQVLSRCLQGILERILDLLYLQEQEVVVMPRK